MRVAIGGLMHETNTFARGTTTLADFQAYQYAVGDELFGFRGTKTELGGFLDGCRQLGLGCRTQPSCGGPARRVGRPRGVRGASSTG